MERGARVVGARVVEPPLVGAAFAAAGAGAAGAVTGFGREGFAAADVVCCGTGPVDGPGCERAAGTLFLAAAFESLCPSCCFNS